jgi:hypothetical protein
LWTEAINDFKGFPGIDGELKKIIQTAKEVGGEGYANRKDDEM